MSKPLLDASNMLEEARDFCEAIFMAAAGLNVADETAVFQRIAEEAKKRIGTAIDLIDDLREGKTRQ